MKYVIFINSWRPAGLNQMLCSVRARIRSKKADRVLVVAYSRMASVPPAKGKRRVSLEIGLGPGQRPRDRDNLWKSLLDALVQARMLVDDSERWVEHGSVTYDPVRDGTTWTRIILEDVEGQRGGDGAAAGVGQDQG